MHRMCAATYKSREDENEKGIMKRSSSLDSEVKNGSTERKNQDAASEYLENALDPVAFVADTFVWVKIFRD